MKVSILCLGDFFTAMHCEYLSKLRNTHRVSETMPRAHPYVFVKFACAPADACETHAHMYVYVMYCNVVYCSVV